MEGGWGGGGVGEWGEWVFDFGGWGGVYTVVRVSWLGGTTAGCQALRLRGFEGSELQGFRVAAFRV